MSYNADKDLEESQKVFVEEITVKPTEKYEPSGLMQGAILLFTAIVITIMGTILSEIIMGILKLGALVCSGL